jgi:SagB-type dehydrogenase family enzyme
MSNQDTKTAYHYHEQTKHSYRSVRSNAHSLDFSNQPIPFKTYPGLKPIPLPHPLEGTETTALSAVSAATSVTKEERIPTLSDLARLLYFSAGITRQKDYPGRTLLFRAASCTGALYEVELYVVCGDLPDLPAGIYHFSPKDFALYRLREGDCRVVVAQASGEEPCVAAAPALILSTGTYWRNAWKYGARTYRHFGWDNGTIVAHLLAMGSALQLPTRLVLGFLDEELNQLLDLDSQREVTLSIVSLGAMSQTAAEPSPKVEVLGLPTLPLPEREVDYPEMRTLHSATSLLSEKEVALWRGKTPTRTLPAPEGPVWKLDPEPKRAPDSIEKVIQRRGSSRQFEHKPISFQEFSTMLYCSAQGISADFLEPTGVLLNDWYLIVSAVEGLPSGAYVLHREGWLLELLKEGDFRNEAGFLGLEQRLPADASANVFFLADLEAILEQLGNRGYRAVQLEAGILGGKLYLTAYAQRLGATGLTFYDDAVVEFFSPHAQGKSAIFLMALGHGKKGLS